MAPNQFCTNCGSSLSPDTKFCARCGTPVSQAAAAGQSPTGGPKQASSRGSSPARSSSSSGKSTPGPLESLARLGIRVTKNQVVTVIVATISGLVFNKLLPFLYPIIFARPLDWIFGPGASSTRDSFNTFFFTLLTAAFSFLAAYFISRAGGLLRRKKAHG